MRITHDALLKVVRDTVTQRTRTDRGIISIYLCGSLLGDEFLLGGSADIDLVIIHTDEILQDREIVRLTEEIHLDIAHHLYRDYRQTRQLRLHPWLGPTLNECLIQYDPQHFLDFTKASVRGQFDRSDFVYERARKQVEHARQIWSGFHADRPAPDPKVIDLYLRAVDHAANGVASLSGHPLTERRYLLNFPRRAENVGRPGLYPGLLGLIGAPNADADALRAWVPSWRAAYEAFTPGQAPARLHPDRLSYYLNAFEKMLSGPQPQAVLWPLLRTWTLAVMSFPESSATKEGWQGALQYLGLQGEAFNERIDALDAYLDLVEETIEKWAQDNGAAV